MTYVTTRDDSGNYQFRMRTPAALLPDIQGQKLLVALPGNERDKPCSAAATVHAFIKFSLRTRDLEFARVRAAAARFQVESFLSAAKAGPAPVSHKQLISLAGEVYRYFERSFSEDPGEPEEWAAFKGFNRAVVEGRVASAPPILPDHPASLEAAVEAFGDGLTEGINALPRARPTWDAFEARFGPIASWVLMQHGLVLEGSARRQLLLHVARAATDVAWRLKRNAQGDYSPDPAAAKYPAFERTVQLTFTELFDRWKRESKPSASTLSSWSTCLKSLRAHIGHDDAKRLSDEDVISWKDALLERGLLPKTVRDGHLAALKSLLSYAVANKLLSTNVAASVKVRRRAAAGNNRLGYSDEEVASILGHALLETLPYKRWLPWLAAATGARIGELAQLHGSNITREDGIVVVEITPKEGGRLKNEHSERRVPLHPELIRQGFLAFVEARGAGPLFYGRTSGDPERKPASKGTTNRLAAWIRKLGFEDPRKAPNHAFRHWFKTTAHAVGVPDSTADRLQGHASRSEADDYRHPSIATLYRAVAMIPLPPANGDEP